MFCIINLINGWNKVICINVIALIEWYVKDCILSDSNIR